MKVHKTTAGKVKNILKDKKLSIYDLGKIFDYSGGGLSQMIKGERPFSKKIIKKLLPILEISKKEFELWVISDKFPKALLKKAVESFKNRKNKKVRVFTQNIDKLLAEKNISRTSFANAIKYNQSGLNRMIIGKISVSEAVMKKISDGLEIPEDEIQAWILADKYSLKTLEQALTVE